jgi:hypothetical protein
MKRWTLAAGAAGLVAGLALGVSGLASAADPTPSATAGPDRPRPHDGLHRKGPMGHGPGAGGLVSAVTAGSLTVRTPDGTRTIGLTSSTTYYEGRTAATRDAVDVGDVVAVRLADPAASTPVASVVQVLPAHLGGWVTRVAGSTITITDPAGFTRTIATTSATTYRKDGAAATAAAVTVGSFVRALGAVAADGTTLDAASVEVGRPGPGRPHAEGPEPGLPG